MDNHLDIYINNNIDKDSSEAKYNVNFSNANHAGWFSDNIEYQNQEAKASYPDTYGPTENTHGGNLDPIMQSASSVAANSLQNFVEEALRSVEDGIASLDHGELNMIVEKQREATSTISSPCSITNSVYASTSPSSNASSSDITKTFSYTSNDSTNAVSSRLDLSQVVSEIFNDDDVPMEQPMAETCKDQSTFQIFEVSNHGTKSLSSITGGLVRNLSNENNAQSQNSLSVSLPTAPSNSSCNTSHLKVSPMVLQNVLSKSNWYCPTNSCPPFEVGKLENSTSVASPNGNLQYNRYVNTHPHININQSSLPSSLQQCLPQSSQKNHAPASHQAPIDPPISCPMQPSLQRLQEINQLHVGHSLSVDRIKLPQQPLPKSIVTDLQGTGLALTTHCSSVQNPLTKKETKSIRQLQPRKRSPNSSLSHSQIGNNVCSSNNDTSSKTSQMGPSIAIQTNGASINPTLKMALEKSLNKVLFGSKLKTAEQQVKSSTNRDQYLSSSNIKKGQEVEVESYSNSREQYSQLKYQDQIMKERLSGTTNKIISSSETSKTPLEMKVSIGISNCFSRETGNRETGNTLLKSVYPSSVTSDTNTNRSSTNLAYPNFEEHMNMSSLPSHNVSYENNCQASYQNSSYETSVNTLELDMPPSVASSHSVSSDIHSSVTSDGKISSSFNDKDSCKSSSPGSHYDLDFEKIVNEVESMYQDEHLRNSEGHFVRKIEEKDKPSVRNDQFLLDLPVAYEAQKGNSATNKIQNKLNLNSNQANSLIPCSIKTHNNNYGPVSRKENVNRSGLSGYHRKRIDQNGYDNDADVLVENFAEVASNRALSNIADLLIEDVLEEIISTSARPHYSNQISSLKEKENQSSLSDDLDSSFSCFVNDMILDNAGHPIEKSFGGLYRPHEIKTTDADYILSQGSNQSNHRLVRWRGSSHTCDEKCQRKIEEEKAEKVEERTFNAGGSATNNPLYRMKLLRRRIKRLKEKKMQTEKVNKRKLPEVKHKNQENIVGVRDGNSSMEGFGNEKNAITDNALSESIVHSPQQSGCNYDLVENEWFATHSENSNFEVQKAKLNDHFDHHPSNSETKDTNTPSSDSYYSSQEYMSNSDTRKNNQKDMMKEHYNTKVTHAKVLNGQHDSTFNSKQVDETSYKGSSHIQMTTCITDISIKEKEISKSEEKKVRLVNSFGNNKAIRKRKRNTYDKKTQKGLQQVPLKYEESFTEDDCIKDNGIIHERIVNNSLELQDGIISNDFNIHNSNHPNEIFNMNDEGYKYFSEQNFAQSSQQKSKFSLSKTTTPEIGNYDPCNMIDDEPDSDEYPTKQNPKSSEQLDDQNKEINEEAVSKNEEKLSMSNSSFFGHNNYSPHRNVQFLKL